MPNSPAGTIHVRYRHNGWDLSIPPARTVAPVAVIMPCSLCGDLRISDIVGQPDRVVSLYSPRQVLE